MNDHSCDTYIVVPCYNEAKRLPTAEFHQFAAACDGIRFLFVNDGSSDETAELLAEIAASNPQRFEFLDLPRNSGKAEAVRQGMIHALDASPVAIGFWDADLSTPLESIPDFRRVLQQHETIEMVIGSRLPLLGRQIHRKPIRKVLGRIFATVASIVLGLRIQDTQCGAKLFRVTPQLRSIIAEPFLAKWIFDVELFARFRQLHRQAEPKLCSADYIYEQPIDRWEEVGSSRLKSQDFAAAILDLSRIYWRHLRPWARPYLGTTTDERGPDVLTFGSDDEQPSRRAA
ncbi:MAG: glycosyltransferase [Planctomycetaceae bacterium]|nr:glycosyltransferase [Planctomycetales bacterium]MCB9872569.1 glycosyltransferase [Planctomycetaceae bacterium]MCB9939605.1 glycosyltransferase [Planctomycetaceae bacterium]HRX82392.1 glycosyltransferase [Pirellulaceae bacterium]